MEFAFGCVGNSIWNLCFKLCFGYSSWISPLASADSSFFLVGFSENSSSLVCPLQVSLANNFKVWCLWVCGRHVYSFCLVSTLVLFFGGEMTDKHIKSKEELEDCLWLEVCVYVSDRNYTFRIVLRTTRDEVKDVPMKISIKALFMTEKHCNVLNI